MLRILMHYFVAWAQRVSLLLCWNDIILVYVLAQGTPGAIDIRVRTFLVLMINKT
jgi:hypothetical protein